VGAVVAERRHVPDRFTSATRDAQGVHAALAALDRRMAEAVLVRELAAAPLTPRPAHGLRGRQPLG